MIDNIEVPGITQLWSAQSTPWDDARPWFYPEYTRINNIEI